MTDPRRAKIAEAMESHDGEEWIVGKRKGGVLSIGLDGIAGEVVGPGCDDKDAHSIALSHNAIPAAVELIDELTAEVERLRGYIAQIEEHEVTVDDLERWGR